MRVMTHSYDFFLVHLHQKMNLRKTSQDQNTDIQNTTVKVFSSLPEAMEKQ